MKVTEVRARAAMVPLKRPPRAASGEIPEAPFVLVDLVTDAGTTGRAYVFTFTRGMLGPTRDCVSALGDLILGEALAPLELDATMRRALTLLDTPGLVGIALSGIDMAAWDALAQAQGLPLARLLGGEPRPIPAYNSCGLWIGDDASLPDEADALLAEGDFRALKIRLGRPRFEDDLAAVRAVKARVGDGIELMSDFNQSLSTHEALRRCRALDDEGLGWIEEPINHARYDQCATIRAAVETPIQIGENLLGPLEFQKAIDAGAADLYMPDVQRIGGVTGWLRAAALAQVHDLPLSSHLFPEFSAHLLAVSPTCHWLEYMDWADAILEEPLRIEAGCVQISERPGAGIAWDEAALAQFLV